MKSNCILIFAGLPMNFGFCNWLCRIFKNISGHCYYYYHHHHHHHHYHYYYYY